MLKISGEGLVDGIYISDLSSSSAESLYEDVEEPTNIEKSTRIILLTT